MSKNNCISKFQFIFALVIKAFFVYCKVVKEKEYSSFLNQLSVSIITRNVIRGKQTVGLVLRMQISYMQ